MSMANTQKPLAVGQSNLILTATEAACTVCSGILQALILCFRISCNPVPGIDMPIS